MQNLRNISEGYNNITAETASTNNSYVPFQVEMREVVTQAVFGFLLLTLNFPVFLIVPRIRSLHYSLRCIMISLAIADFSFGIEICMRLLFSFIYRSHVFTGWFCKWDAFFTLYFVSVSINSLACINLDKCLTLKYPLHYKHFMTKKKTLVAVYTMWFIIFIMCIPVVIPFSSVIPKFNKGGYCLFDLSYNLVYSMVILAIFQYIPGMVIFISFVHIWILSQRTNKTILQSSPGSHPHGNKQLKVVRILVLMTFCFFLMWTPYTVLVFYPLTFGLKDFGQKADFITGWLGSSNSMINPLLYLATLKSYRKMFVKMLGCSKDKRPMSRRPTSSKTTASSDMRKNSHQW